jgi:hypothetical protein
MYYKTIQVFLAKSLIISFQYNIESVYFIYSNPVYQDNETNVMHFLFSLLRIKGLYMFRALLAHPQEALQKQYLVYFVLKLVGI